MFTIDCIGHWKYSYLIFSKSNCLVLKTRTLAALSIARLNDFVAWNFFHKTFIILKNCVDSEKARKLLSSFFIAFNLNCAVDSIFSQLLIFFYVLKFCHFLQPLPCWTFFFFWLMEFFYMRGMDQNKCTRKYNVLHIMYMWVVTSSRYEKSYVMKIKGRCLSTAI